MKILYACLGVFLLFQLQQVLYRRFWDKNLSVQLSFSKNNAVEGDELVLYETVTNQKLLPIPILKIKFMTSRYLSFLDTRTTEVTDHYYRNDILSVMMYQKLTRSVSFACSHRGYFTIDKVFLICNDIFLNFEHIKSCDMGIHLYVYPKPVDYDRISIPFQKMFGTILTKRCLNEDPFEFRSIREYQTYDALKTINWKASAKTGSLMVNVYDYTSSQQVKILLNLESETLWRYETLEEESIRLAASFAAAFIEQGIPASLYSNSPNPLTGNLFSVPAGSSPHHIQTINETLSRIDTSLTMPGFISAVGSEIENASSNDTILIISTYQKEDLQEQLSCLAKNKIDFSWMIPYNKEIKLHIRNELLPHVIYWEMEK
jgi:Uncharacterized conserved protein (some members contain a von Willebrand factor type A (vWA) domain)